MSMNGRNPEKSGNPVVKSRIENGSVTGRDEEKHLSPVQRMRGKIQLADPEIIRRIIFDPLMES
jgi:hypothetical protein